MKKENIREEVEAWLLSVGKNRKLVVPENFAWFSHGDEDILHLPSKLLLERYYMPEEAFMRIAVSDNRCCIGLAMSLGKFAPARRGALETFLQKTEGEWKSPGRGDLAICERQDLTREDLEDGCTVAEYLDNELEELNQNIDRWLSPRHEDYLRYIGPCHSQDDYGFQFLNASNALYHGEDCCFVYVVVKDNSRTHAVQLRIKDRDDNWGTGTLYPEKLPAILEELKTRMPHTTVRADPVDKVPAARDRAIRNVTINFTSDAGKEEAMTRLAEAWLAAIGLLPSLQSLNRKAEAWAGDSTCQA